MQKVIVFVMKYFKSMAGKLGELELDMSMNA